MSFSNELHLKTISSSSETKTNRPQVSISLWQNTRIAWKKSADLEQQRHLSKLFLLPRKYLRTLYKHTTHLKSCKFNLRGLIVAMCLENWWCEYIVHVHVLPCIKQKVFRQLHGVVETLLKNSHQLAVFTIKSIKIGWWWRWLIN